MVHMEYMITRVRIKGHRWSDHLGVLVPATPQQSWNQGKSTQPAKSLLPLHLPSQVPQSRPSSGKLQEWHGKQAAKGKKDDEEGIDEEQKEGRGGQTSRENSRAGPPNFKQAFAFPLCPKEGMRGSEVKSPRKRLTSTQGDSPGRGSRQDKHNEVMPCALSSTERYFFIMYAMFILLGTFIR